MRGTAPRWFAACLPALAALALFWPAAGYEFLDYDDPLLLTANPLVQRPCPANLARLVSAPAFGDYQPLPLLTYALEWSLVGPTPAAFHLTNVALHALSALLVGLLFAPHLGGRRARAAALLFALHPLAVEPVCWVASRKDTLMLPLLLAAALCHRRAASEPGRGLAWGGLGLLLGALALLSKTAAVVLPLLLLLERAAARGRLAPLPRELPWLALHAVLAAVAVSLKLLALREVGFAGPEPPPGGWPARAHLVAHTVGAYLAHGLAPVGLHLNYDPQRASPALAWLGALAGLLCGVALLRGPGRRAGVWLGALWAAAGVLPGAQLVLFPFWAADRYAYVALPGLAAALAGLLLPAARASAPRAGWAFLGVLALCAALSALQARLWRDSAALWSGTLRRDPDNRVAPLGVARVSLRRGELELARRQLEEVRARQPDNPRVPVLLAQLALVRGDPAEAERLLRDLSPADRALELGSLLLAQGRREEAEQVASEGLRAGQTSPALLHLVGRLALETGRVEEAASGLERAVASEPARAEAWLLLARARALQGDARGARHALRRGEEVGAGGAPLDEARATVAALDSAGR